MRVYVNDLIEGCILSSDVPGKLSRPILTRKTVLSAKLIEVLKAFLVKEVDVEKTLVSGMPFNPSLQVKNNKFPTPAANTKTGELNFIEIGRAHV